MARFAWLGPLRERARRGFFALLQEAVNTDTGHRMLVDALKGALTPVRPGVLAELDDHPYDLGTAVTTRPSAVPIFITARFRSGSTLVWNLFRHVPGCTAYYEPLNERRWFDPSCRGDRIDATHVGVTDYWREYEGLAHLAQHYREDWIRRQLYMDDDSWDPALAAYIRGLIAAAPHRAVLQFNRVDFRLPWLRRHFRAARFIHLYRNPRDQWCSSLLDVSRVPRHVTVAQFEAHDHFYLVNWARDLSCQFPFLDPDTADHPYDLFYWIWKLSYLFGRQYCDHSFGFESLSAAPETQLPQLMHAAQVSEYSLEVLKTLVVPQKSKRRQYAEDGWYAEREARCEEVLAEFLSGEPARPDAVAQRIPAAPDRVFEPARGDTPLVVR